MLTDDRCFRAGLCPVSFGLALGITKGLGVAILAWVAMRWGVGIPVVNIIASVYHGYAATAIGGLKGGLWGLVDGFVFGAIIAMIYNCCVRCCKCCVRKTEL